MNQTCMCWGIDTGDGWHGLLDWLCGAIQSNIDGGDGKIEQVEAAQVEEKFGPLRLYYDGDDETINSWIGYTEYLSGHVCEQCGGTNGSTTHSDGWMTTLCRQCRASGK